VRPSPVFSLARSEAVMPCAARIAAPTLGEGARRALAVDENPAGSPEYPSVP